MQVIVQLSLSLFFKEKCFIYYRVANVYNPAGQILKVIYKNYGYHIC